MTRWRWVAMVVALGWALQPREARAQDNPGDWGMVQFNRERGLTKGVITGPADSAWSTLKQLLTDAGIPVALEDRGSWQLGNQRFRAIRRLGKSPISRFFFCGENLTGPNADSYYVFIRLVIGLRPARDRTPFEMHLYAEAVDVPGGRPERLPCITTGLFELQLVRRLNDAFPGTK